MPSVNALWVERFFPDKFLSPGRTKVEGTSSIEQEKGPGEKTPRGFLPLYSVLDTPATDSRVARFPAADIAVRLVLPSWVFLDHIRRCVPTGKQWNLWQVEFEFTARLYSETTNNKRRTASNRNGCARLIAHKSQ